MTSTSQPDWSAVRADYVDAQMRIHEILEKHGISRYRLYQKIAELGWPRRSDDGLARDALTFRLMAVLERQIALLEMNMEDTPSDKDVALLGTLTRNLEKLVALDAKTAGNKDPAQKRRDIEALRKKLTERLEQLKKA